MGSGADYTPPRRAPASSGNPTVLLRALSRARGAFVVRGDGRDRSWEIVAPTLRRSRGWSAQLRPLPADGRGNRASATLVRRVPVLGRVASQRILSPAAPQRVEGGPRGQQPVNRRLPRARAVARSRSAGDTQRVASIAGEPPQVPPEQDHREHNLDVMHRRGVLPRFQHVTGAVFDPVFHGVLCACSRQPTAARGGPNRPSGKA